jgi:hypothetical protein
MITPRAAPALLHPLTGVSRSCLSPVRNDFADPLRYMPGPAWLADDREGTEGPVPTTVFPAQSRPARHLIADAASSGAAPRVSTPDST